MKQLYRIILYCLCGNKNNLLFHSKGLVCSTKELNGTITDVSDEYYDNKEEINFDIEGF
jgi:hypothetical protein